ncbi:MAG: dUTP diphosphatase [Candidatus Buchananbacteria bacterium CG10_big_fil_rev_8_21_14_0_10_42_9]|uniref:dUTP diphosphatase n=1 Tax=Candidatus Buchananbacteria bacterium CG10_big_fil_rev_8_21_14_0_10_42_9 TaxID=1974526 RepID=A0A2H0W2Q5_9BACT|nr:MAG: dUTP diphosphatase [Candidatus Buchananbacteria bacterium CG10_big_fil_rev_8_21_14_0_10_42_9]
MPKLSPKPIKVKLLHPDAQLPTRAYAGDAGLDLYAIEDSIIPAGKHGLIKFGLAVEIPEGYVGFIKDRGSMGRSGLHVIGGVMDSNYRGEYICSMINASDSDYKIEKGHRVAQLVILPYFTGLPSEADELSESERGEKRYASSGK